MKEQEIKGQIRHVHTSEHAQTPRQPDTCRVAIVTTAFNANTGQRSDTAQHHNNYLMTQKHFYSFSI